MRLTLNRNLQANAFYSIALFFLSKIQKGNKSDLNRRFKRRLSPGLKPAIFSRFPAIFPQNEYFTTVFFGTIIFSFDYILFFSIISFNTGIFSYIIKRHKIKFKRSLNKKPDLEFKSRYPWVFLIFSRYPPILLTFGISQPNVDSLFFSLIAFMLIY